MILDGININIQAADSGGESQVFVADNPSAWNDANYTGYTNRGLMHRADGYMNKALLGVGAEFVPSEAGISGSGTGTYYCDYFYTSIPASGTSLRMLIVGGNAVVRMAVSPARLRLTPRRMGLRISGLGFALNWVRSTPRFGSFEIVLIK
jgi:hypothetical protein